MEQNISSRLVWLLGQGAQGARLESALVEMGSIEMGPSCERFETVEALQEAMQSDEPGLVLACDQLFGAAGALESFVSSVRQLAAAKLAVVVVTDDGSIEMRRRMFEAGVDDFVLEPVVVSELLTRVRCQLMLNADASHRHQVQTPAVADAGADLPLSILVADAEPMIQRVLRSAFERRGWSVATASDGREVLQLFGEGNFDVVIFDLSLPYINGFELLGELGGASTPRRPRMVVLSAERQQDSVLRAFELGADDFVSKPVNPDILVARILRLVRPPGDGVLAR
jgi:two-component system response regulator VicR